MSTLSGLFPVASTSPIKSIQTGYVNTNSITGGGGEDAGYINVTISAVTTAKCEVSFVGGFVFGTDGLTAAMGKSGSGFAYSPTVRLTSTTNLRISMPGDNTITTGRIAGRWQVVEYN